MWKLLFPPRFFVNRTMPVQVLPDWSFLITLKELASRRALKKGRVWTSRAWSACRPNDKDSEVLPGDLQPSVQIIKKQNGWHFVLSLSAGQETKAAWENLRLFSDWIRFLALLKWQKIVLKSGFYFYHNVWEL